MGSRTGKNFLAAAALAAIFSAAMWAANHHALNGTWQLVPARSEFHGESAIQTGTVTIYDREHNIYVSRNFNFEQGNTSTTTKFETDARHNASIKEPGFKSKAKWDGDVLKVMTTQDGNTVSERYSLLGDGTMVLQVERGGHQPETLYFQRE
jgi:hypothetical protein